MKNEKAKTDQRLQKEVEPIVREYYVGPGMPPPKPRKAWYKRILSYMAI